MITAVSNLVAQNTTSGGIFISNTGDLTIGFTGEPFLGIQDTGASHRPHQPDQRRQCVCRERGGYHPGAQ